MSSRLAALLAIALAACAALPAAGAPPDDPAAAVARLHAADAAAQQASAQLALLRTRARALSGAALERNRARQAALERRKLRLLGVVPDAHADATRALERHRAAIRAARRAQRVAAERPVAPAPTPAPAPIPAAAPVPDRASPAALAGDDAGLARAIDAYLASKASPLTGHGADFVRSSRAVGLDPRFLVAIAGAETSFATYGPSQGIRNPFGMGPGFVYESWTEAIDSAARNLGGDLYLGDGRVTIADIHARWAPIGAGNDPTGLNDNWTRNVGHYYAELGGDPSLPVFGGAAAPAAAPAAVPAPPDAPDVPAPSPGDRVGPGAKEHAAPADGSPAATAPAGPLLARVFAAPAGRGPIIDAAAP